MGQKPSKHDRNSGAIQMQTYSPNNQQYLTETDQKEVYIRTKSVPSPSPPLPFTLKPPPPALLNPFTTTSHQTPRRVSIKQPPNPSNNDDYHATLTTFLNEYNLVFVIDDSTSMQERGRWQNVTDVLAAIAPMCANHSPDNAGIDVYFLNHRSVSETDELGFSFSERSNTGGYTDLRTAVQVREVFETIEPRGLTPFGTRLGQLLQPYLRRVENMMIARYNHRNSSRSHGHEAEVEAEARFYVKPLYVVAITDGAFTDDAVKELARAGRRLDGCRAVPWQLYVQFLQVGKDEGARMFLEALEGELRREREREGMGMGREMVVFPGRSLEFRYGELSAEGVLRGVVRAATTWV